MKDCSGVEARLPPHSFPSFAYYMRAGVKVAERTQHLDGCKRICCTSPTVPRRRRSHTAFRPARARRDSTAGGLERGRDGGFEVRALLVPALGMPGPVGTRRAALRGRDDCDLGKRWKRRGTLRQAGGCAGCLWWPRQRMQGRRLGAGGNCEWRHVLGCLIHA